ncbi:hypothetical protein ERJ75_000821700 [Trypanosoma vivax]|nr:hypothetical protein ERJ75_000821700 [Trypanosoma vivax]
MFWSLVAAQLIAEPVLAGRRYALRCPQRACCVTGGGCVEAPDAPAHPLDGTRNAQHLRGQPTASACVSRSAHHGGAAGVLTALCLPVVPDSAGAVSSAAARVPPSLGAGCSGRCTVASRFRALLCAFALPCALRCGAASSAAYRRCVGALPAISRWRAARCGSPWARGCRLAVRAQWALDAPPLRRVEGDLFGVPQVNVEPLVRDTRSALRRREAETPRRPKRTA